MKLAFRKSPISLKSSNCLTKKAESLQAATWVKIKKLPSPYSYDEALLLCQHSETEWVVWIPDHGEMIIHRSRLGEVC